MQPESELGASKKKQTQINTSNFGFFCFYLFLRLFFRIETFQWVTADSNKKISLPLDSPVRLCLKRLVASASSFWALGNLRISMRESIRRDRGSAKDLFAATGVLQRKIKARQWLEREGAEGPITGDRRLWGSPSSRTGCQRFPSGGRRETPVSAGMSSSGI
jgi:hypothetical protein